MRNFDGVLVNMIIDELAERSGPSEPFDRVPISNYSTVSSKWVKRTQGYHFRFIHLAGQKGVKKWCTSIQADPLGVSRHVRRFNLVGIDTLEGFEKHIRALTRVQEVELSDCGILRSLSDVEVFTLLGSSLVRLDIDGALTTPHVMASLLAGLPRLRKLSASGLEVECDPNPTALPPKIPFVEDANSLDLLMTKYCLGGLSWIPPTARFRDLGIEAYCINKDSALVNNWLTSSGGCLQWLTIREDSWCLPFPSLDLSRCTALDHLQLPVPLACPGQYAEAVLPSLSSSQPSNVVLHLQGPKVGEINPKNWEKMDNDLCRLAKRFKAANGGKMVVRISVSDWYAYQVLEELRDEWPMPGLEEETSVVIPKYENFRALGRAISGVAPTRNL